MEAAGFVPVESTRVGPTPDFPPYCREAERATPVDPRTRLLLHGEVRRVSVAWGG